MKNRWKALEKYCDGGNSVLLIFVTLAGIFSMLSPNFMTLFNLKNLLLQNTHMIVIVLGLAFVMIGGGIDLSVGYQISLITVVMGKLFSMGAPYPLAVAAGFLAGALCGACNGILVAFCNIVPFAATLATQVIFHGLSYWISSGRTYSRIPASFQRLTGRACFGVQADVWVTLICLIVVGIVFRFTFYGKYIRAIGQDEVVTARTGVNVRKTKMFCYMIAGVFFALAAMLLVSKQSIASSANGVGMEINGIAAAYIGGVPGQAEEVRVRNLVLGVLIMAMIDNGLQMSGGNQYLQYVITGIILIISMIARKLHK